MAKEKTKSQGRADRLAVKAVDRRIGEMREMLEEAQELVCDAERVTPKLLRALRVAEDACFNLADMAEGAIEETNVRG